MHGPMNVTLMDIIAAWLIDIVFFSAGLRYVLYGSQAYFIMLSLLLSVTHTICLHFHFSVKVRPHRTRAAAAGSGQACRRKCVRNISSEMASVFKAYRN